MHCFSTELLTYKITSQTQERFWLLSDRWKTWTVLMPNSTNRRNLLDIEGRVLYTGSDEMCRLNNLKDVSSFIIKLQTDINFDNPHIWRIWRHFYRSFLIVDFAIRRPSAVHYEGSRHRSQRKLILELYYQLQIFIFFVGLRDSTVGIFFWVFLSQFPVLLKNEYYDLNTSALQSIIAVFLVFRRHYFNKPVQIQTKFLTNSWQKMQPIHLRRSSSSQYCRPLRKMTTYVEISRRHEQPSTRPGPDPTTYIASFARPTRRRMISVIFVSAHCQLIWPRPRSTSNTTLKIPRR